MFLLNSFQPGSLCQQSWCRRIMRSVFALFVVSCLSATLLFTGCQIDDDDNGFVDDHKLNQSLIGTWLSEYADGYIITANDIAYDFGGGYIGYAGTIEYVSNFSDIAGVIIIKYKAGQEQTYPIYDEDWNIIGYNERPGNYVGIYYDNFKPGISVEMGTALNMADYTGAEKITLDEAKAAFTKGKEGDYIGKKGAYLRKP